MFVMACLTPSMVTRRRQKKSRTSCGWGPRLLPDLSTPCRHVRLTIRSSLVLVVMTTTTSFFLFKSPHLNESGSTMPPGGAPFEPQLCSALGLVTTQPCGRRSLYRSLCCVEDSIFSCKVRHAAGRPLVDLTIPMIRTTTSPSPPVVEPTPGKEPSFLQRLPIPPATIPPPLPRSKFFRYSRERNNAELSKGIAQLYDEATSLWEDLWGEHLHHSYYPEGKWTPDHKRAQVEMVQRVITWALHFPPDQTHKSCDSPPFIPRRVLDVGCGVGGSARHLARTFGCNVTGITLSPLQCNKANKYSKDQSLDHLTKFEVVDAIKTPYTSRSYDLVWALESAEHMPDKHLFVEELKRLLTPNGRVVVVTWCHRNLKHDETLKTSELRLLSAINYCYYLPEWWSIKTYEEAFKRSGLVDIRTADWTPYVQHFWQAVIWSALTPKGIKGALTNGFRTFRGALALVLMWRAYSVGLVKFQLITARKPTISESIFRFCTSKL